MSRAQIDYCLVIGPTDQRLPWWQITCWLLVSIRYLKTLWTILANVVGAFGMSLGEIDKNLVKIRNVIMMSSR